MLTSRSPPHAFECSHTHTPMSTLPHANPHTHTRTLGVSGAVANLQLAVEVAGRGFDKSVGPELSGILAESVKTHADIAHCLSDLLRFERRGRHVWPFER